MLAVAAPLRLAAVERLAAPDRDERVLQHPAPAQVDVHVVRRRDGYLEPAGELAQVAQARPVAARERPHQLDVEAPGEGLCERASAPLRACAVAGRERRREGAVAQAAAQAVEALGVREQRRERRGGRERRAVRGRGGCRRAPR